MNKIVYKCDKITQIFAVCLPQLKLNEVGNALERVHALADLWILTEKLPENQRFHKIAFSEKVKSHFYLKDHVGIKFDPSLDRSLGQQFWPLSLKISDLGIAQ